jgi:site-specific DNA-methyltransferase (adenine-specific)
VEWLRTLPSASVDLIVTDPPYESLEKHRAIGTTTRLKHSKASSNDWFSIFPNARFPEFFAEAYRVLSKDRHFYLFCDPETMFVAKPIAERAGFKFWKPLVWDKVSIGMGYHYRSRYEFVLFFEKGKRKLANLGVADIIEQARIRGQYPAEKPVGVADVLVRQSTREGELVVDPFMGSGSTGCAALALGRRFAGTDISPTAVSLARSRLSTLA